MSRSSADSADLIYLGAYTRKFSSRQTDKKHLLTQKQARKMSFTASKAQLGNLRTAGSASPFVAVPKAKATRTISCNAKKVLIKILPQQICSGDAVVASTACLQRHDTRPSLLPVVLVSCIREGSDGTSGKPLRQMRGLSSAPPA